ncbi:hypothetical protein [Massilia aquatica]|uniref:DUF4304 domain-containing protein n=1 Tax=Massilia aquatica TaxID=2609000 RepID=A0ABX0M3X1_9BURK|nr:hypothetical protein [Massilia aquatica]NHZ39738.1 hypothetical protein [Massilia aquatica]
MKKSEARAALYAGIDDMLAGLGFQSRKKDEVFERKFDGGFQRIYVMLMDRSPKIAVDYLVSLRFDSVQAITHPYIWGAADDYMESGTYDIVLPYFAPAMPNQFFVENLDDLNAHLNALCPVFANHIVPLLQECLDLRDFERKANADENMAHGSRSNSAYAGIAAAYLVNPGEFEEVVERRLGLMRRMGSHQNVIEPVEKMANDLRIKRGTGPRNTVGT